MADTRSGTELPKYARQFLKACSSGWDCYAICNMIRVRFQELYYDQPMSFFEFTVSFKIRSIIAVASWISRPINEGEF
jgi:hypothetical protein